MPCGSDGNAPSLMRDHPAARGLSALREGRPREALAHFDALIAAEPSGVPGWFLRTEALIALGETAEARALLLELVGRFPFAEGACRERLAVLALRGGDADAALAALTRAAEVGWSNADAIRRDPAFAAFAGDARFAAVFEAAERNEPSPA